MTLLKACLHQYGNIMVKLYHRFLKSLRILAMIQMHYKQFLGHRTLRESCPALHAARDENRIAWDASCERVVIYF